MEYTVEEQDSTVTIRVSGKLSATESPELEEAISAVNSAVCNFDLDLKNLEYISSAGLRVLVATGKTAASRGGAMRLLSPSKEVKDILEMTGLSTIFTITDA